VGGEVFRLFLEAVRGASVTITNQNISELSQLCTEFAFNGLANELSAFRSSPDFKDVKAADARICALEDRLSKVELFVNSETPKHERAAEALNAAIAHLSQVELFVNLQVAEQKQTAEALGAAVTRLSQVEESVESTTTQHQTQITALRDNMNSQLPKQQVIAQALATHSAEIKQLHHDVNALQAWRGPRGVIESLIVSDFPPLFDEFWDRKLELLWRGSRDGFGAHDFHSRCDGHTDTLTLIVTTASVCDDGGFVFGGFTRVEWESIVPEGNGNN
jgi:hypothetical protein